MALEQQTPVSLSFSSATIMILCTVVLVEITCLIPIINGQTNDDNNFNYYYSYSNNNNNNDQERFAEDEFLSDWNNQEWGKLSSRIPQPKCVDIPSNLTLCHGIGYKQMMLPNLLDHDSLNEVTQQAASWVPLTRINCHPDAKVFLCSLFSPVCLDRMIYPCRSLCEGVQASCVGRMKAYGFDWPDMLKCDKFPLDNDMCIKLIHDVRPDNNCTACKHPLTHESLIDQFCRAEIAMRVSIKEFKDVGGHKELMLRKKKSVFKQGGLSKSQVRSLNAIIEGGARCSCDRINSTKERYLIMGNKRGEQLVLTFGMVWNRKDKEFKKGINAIRKGNTCEGIFREISANGAESKPSPNEEQLNKTKLNKDKKDNSVKKDKTEKVDKIDKSDKGVKAEKGDKADKSDKSNKKGKGKKGKKEEKGKKEKGKKGKGKKNKDKKSGSSPNVASRRDTVSKSELEDKALSNFMKAAN